MNSVNAVVFEATIDGRFIYVSDEAENLLGYPLQQWLKNEFWYDHIHSDDIEEVKDILKRNTPEQDATYSHDYRMKKYRQ